MSKTLNQHIEEVIEEFDKEFINLMTIVIPKEGPYRLVERTEYVKSFLKSKLTLIAEITREAVKVENSKEIEKIKEKNEKDRIYNVLNENLMWGFNSAIDTQESKWKEFNQ